MRDALRDARPFCMAPDVAEEIVRGRYRIVGKLGEGSQGTTFDAVDQSTGAPVAVKRFVVKGSKSWKDVELAEREATVLASLSHPNLPVHVDHFEENGALYLVMQKIEGESLAALGRKGGTLARADVVRFLSDAAAVLDYLHSRLPPVIHRDINPKNVIRRPDGSFALVDFGAVRDKLKPEGGSTVVGTFGYMATEQFQGRALPASDVYSVGATAIRMLTGTEPENLPHRGLAIDVRAALGRAADPALADALTRMLDPDPDTRAVSITPLLERMERAAAREPASRSNERASRDSSRGDAYRTSDEAYARAKQVARDARDEARRVAREERDAARRVYHDSRRQARAERFRRRGWGRRMPPFFLPAILGLNLAILVVGIMLGAVVPFVLVVLSIFFGRPLRQAAKNVREAGHAAQAALARAQAAMMGETFEERPTADGERVRVEPNAPSRTRVAENPREHEEEDVIDTVGTEAPEGERRRR